MNESTEYVMGHRDGQVHERARIRKQIERWRDEASHEEDLIIANPQTGQRDPFPGLERCNHSVYCYQRVLDLLDGEEPK